MPLHPGHTDPLSKCNRCFHTRQAPESYYSISYPTPRTDIVADKVADMEVDKVVDKVVDMVVDMEVDNVVDMVVDMEVDKVVDMVVEMEVDKVVDMVVDMEVGPHQHTIHTA